MSECVVCKELTNNKERTRSYRIGKCTTIVEISLCKGCQIVPAKYSGGTQRNDTRTV